MVLQVHRLCVVVAAAQGASLLEQLLGNSRGFGVTPFLSQANLTATLKAWPGADVAVFFYSPYGEAGRYAAQALPLWDEVARWHAAKKTKNLLITKFSCEASLAHQQLCYDIGVRQYPTITFYGYGRLSFRRGFLKRATNYKGLAYAEALRDWTVAMHWISWVQRCGDRILQLLGLKPSPERLELIELRAREARRQLELERRLEDMRSDLAAATRGAASSAAQESRSFESLLAGLAAEHDDSAAGGDGGSSASASASETAAFSPEIAAGG